MDKHLKELLGETGFGELDNVQFDTKDEYDAYFAYVKLALKAFNSHIKRQLKNDDKGKTEHTVITYFVTRLLRSIEQLKIKHQFDNTHNIRVDMTDSSFPNHAELRQMKADYKLKEEFIKNLPNTLVLKDKLISKLRKQAEEPLDILDALAKKKYYSTLYPSSIYFIFNKGRLMEVSRNIKENKIRYVYCWACYDIALNRPQIYVLELDSTEINKPLDKYSTVLTKFEEIIENVSEGARTLYDMVAFLDQEIPSIHPRLIKKYDIGPIYGKYSVDQNPFTKFYAEKNLSEEEFVLVYEEHIVVSVGETKVKSNWISNKMPLQDFHINASDKTCSKLKLSDHKKFLIAPHSVIQELLNDPKMTKHMLPYRTNTIAI